MEGLDVKNIKQCIGGKWKWFQKKRRFYITLELQNNKRKAIEIPMDAIPNGAQLYQKFLDGDIVTDESEMEEEVVVTMMENLNLPSGDIGGGNKVSYIPEEGNVSVNLIKLTDDEIALHTKRARPAEAAAANDQNKKRQRMNDDDVEGNYCHSCDRVFLTKYRLEKHLMSQKHRNVRVPCHFCRKLKSYNNVAAHEALCVAGTKLLDVLKARQQTGNVRRIRKAAVAKNKKIKRSQLASRKKNYNPFDFLGTDNQN